jgi:hypothetical protein
LGKWEGLVEPASLVLGLPTRLPRGHVGAWRKLVEQHLGANLKEAAMLWTIFVILLVLWALGMVSSYTLGGFIHILLLIAVAVVLIRIIQGRRPV